jgi:hypothetical protein
VAQMGRGRVELNEVKTLMRTILLTVSLLGTLLFGAAFAVSFLDPLLVERAAREVVRMEVERRVGEKVEALSTARMVVLAQKALGATEAQIAETRRDLAAEVPRKVAEVVAQAQEHKLSSLMQVRQHLVGMVETAYHSVAAHLLREFRIVTGCNALAFALLAAVTWWRRAAALQLLLPAVVLVGATAITAGLCLFSQNWLHTILYSQYVGWSCAAYLGVVASMLANVAFNRARINTL